MPFELVSPAPRRIAIVGGGIAGMAAAWLLRETHHVVLFEAEPRLGGHARTVIAGRHGDRPVDTGFIVFNDVNYPNLKALFDKLGVPVAESSMSFGASIRGGALEYGLAGPRALFAQKRNAFDPRFLGMLRDIFRFNARALDTAAPGMTIRDLLERLGTGAWFCDHYLLPFSGAIWSSPTQGILDFPAQTLVRFFDSHALLHHSGQRRWSTVQGGSREYVARMQAALERSGVEVRTRAPVARVEAVDGGVRLETAAHAAERFDEVVLATHADISRDMVEGHPAATALAEVRYHPNRAVLHADASVMPRRRAVWSSWTYAEPEGPRPERIELTYWMNSLQPIPKDDPLFVTLNATRRIAPESVYDEVTFRHPVYDAAMLRAQEAIRSINGRDRIWFCGAWMRDGFHEDGFASAQDVVQAMTARDAATFA